MIASKSTGIVIDRYVVGSIPPTVSKASETGLRRETLPNTRFSVYDLVTAHVGDHSGNCAEVEGG